MILTRPPGDAPPRTGPPRAPEQRPGWRRVHRRRFERRRLERITRKPNLAGASTSTDLLRAEVYSAAVAAAERDPGVFRLAAPTGLGKTFAQGAFGLQHARAWGKSRVVIAVPFVTITEQNTDVYRGLFDTEEQPVVLEHHSSVRFEPDRDVPAPLTEAQRWGRLAAENWDASFVVTTTVQLFQSLFGRKPSQVRKLHRLANAVLILDEVQHRRGAAVAESKPLLPCVSRVRSNGGQGFSIRRMAHLAAALPPTAEGVDVGLAAGAGGGGCRSER
ncbi:DEAD/DEAH box helicase [Nocardia sp. NPDC051990]|uniref:DEAD/DEAH box helicase n=1 Tax=Nocardia sp. NPDC051990 TaxID=3155285 RepID=UPI0034149AD8